MKYSGAVFALMLFRTKACFKGRKFSFLASVKASWWFHDLSGYTVITIKKLNIYYQFKAKSRTMQDFPEFGIFNASAC